MTENYDAKLAHKINLSKLMNFKNHWLIFFIFSNLCYRVIKIYFEGKGI